MVEVVVDHLCLLGEGPVWDTQRRAICWVDILNGHIHEFDTQNNTFRSIAVKQMIGTVAICTNGDFLAALKSGLAIVKRDSGAVDILTHPESHVPANRFNDGKCDPHGRLWVGTMAIDESPEEGSLYMVNDKLQVEKKIENTTISNGMAWSPDQYTFYYIDTPTESVVAYDYHENGDITNKRIIIDFKDEPGYPDGMTIDNEGMLWIAHWAGWQLSRWDPSTGKKIFALPLPVANVTSCTFGGSALNDLYITTAFKGLSDQERQEQPQAGALFVWKNCGFTGVDTNKFNSVNL